MKENTRMVSVTEKTLNGAAERKRLHPSAPTSSLYHFSHTFIEYQRHVLNLKSLTS